MSDYPRDFSDDEGDVETGVNHQRDFVPHSTTGGASYQNDEEEEEEEEEEEPSSAKQPKKVRAVDDEDDDEDDEDDEEDEEDEEGGGSRPRKRVKKSRPVNRYLDVEAEVDDDEEDVDDEDEDLVRESREGFIEDNDALETEGGRRRIIADHQRLDRRQQGMMDADAAQIAADIRQRHQRSTSRYTGDVDQIPQRLLMPSVNDPYLWQVRCKIGRERDLVFSLMRKSLDLELAGRPLEIYSAFQRDSLPGLLYVEARNEGHVKSAVHGLVGIYASNGINLVPVDEMASLLRLKKQETTITPGSWVRIKRGKYTGDLAQVIDVTDNGEEAGLKLVPRIDYTPKEIDSRKRKKTNGVPLAFRPPQRLFNYDEVAKVYGSKSIARRQGKFVFNGDTYSNGYLEKDFRITGIVTEGVNPPLDEIARFSTGSGSSGDQDGVDLSIIADASKKAATAVLQPGDHVEVFEGEQTGVHGIVESIRDEIVLLRAKGIELEGQRIEVPAASVRKRFKPGDHVKVMAGKNVDETGLVIAVVNDLVTIWSDLSSQEVTVFSKDVREAAEVGVGNNTVGEYELHDLVQLDQQTVGVIFKTERISFRVLDQHGVIRTVQPQQITMRKESTKAIATDSQGYPLRVSDNMKEVDGEQRKGQILHIYQSTYAFLYNREIPENGGVFVARTRSLTSVAPKGQMNNRFGGATNASSANPMGAGGGMVGSGMNNRGPRDRMIGLHIVIAKGEFKGYHGTIKDTNGQQARIELLTNNKIITIDKEKLRRKNPNTGAIEPLEDFRSMGPPSAIPGAPRAPNNNTGRTPNPYNQDGSRTPGWGGTSRTPNPYAGGEGGRTPAWAASSRTPNPYAGDGGRTSAWNASSKTPNPYVDGGSGGSSSAWNTGGRTPNPYTAGSRTPKPGSSTGSGSGAGWGGATPKPGGNSNSWGGATPGRGGTGGWGGATPRGDWGSSTNGADSWGTPAANSAPTPYNTAPTPAPIGDDWGSHSAPTPYVAPTPGALSAPTPGMYNSAPTPGFGLTPGFHDAAHSAQTPASAPTPFPGRFDDETPRHGAVTMDENGDWMIGKRNIWVSFRESYAGIPSGRRAVLVSTLPQGGMIETTATVKFIDGQEANEERGGIPVRLLKGVPPQALKERAEALAGRFKGKIVIIQSSDTPETLAVTVEGSNDFEVYPISQLVKVHEWTS